MSAISDFYLARATASAREARETTLANVRERCLRSEAAWRAMAERVQRSDLERARQAAEKAARDALVCEKFS
ncbi:MAG TPA: hypothetical protein VNS79_14215 [Sphingobium sp.]|nr:hypothetical protein [Sphingobium sp.]